MSLTVWSCRSDFAAGLSPSPVSTFANSSGWSLPEWFDLRLEMFSQHLHCRLRASERCLLLSFLRLSSWSFRITLPSESLHSELRSHAVFDSEALPHPVWLCWRGTPSLLKTNTFFHLVGSPELSKITLMWSVRGQPVKSVTVELL